MGLFGDRPSAVHDPVGYNDQVTTEAGCLSVIKWLVILGFIMLMFSSCNK
jgi:hypothetical protein